MRLRFSLRTLFLLTTVVAGLCLWGLLPSIMARRFLATIAKEDYKSADEFFQNADDRFLADWADKRWGFRSSAELQPLTFGQFWRNQREVSVGITYFQFDQSFHVEMSLAATPFGLKKPASSSTARTGYLYNERSERTVPNR